MMFTTIPLPSLFTNRERCISCNKRIHARVEYMSEFDRTSSFDVNRIDGFVYDYKCHTCVSDRDYNMSDRYNITHPVREYMGEIMMNGISNHTTKGDIGAVI